MLTPAMAALLVFQVFSGILVAPLLTLFPVYVEKELHLSPVFSANIRVLSVVFGGLVALVGGAVSDTLGRKPSYLLAMTGIIAAGLIFLVRSPGLMYGLAVYSGLMFGLGTVAGLSYVMDAAPRHTLALATASYFVGGTLGNALGSAVSGWVAKEVPGGYALLGGTMAAGHALLLLAAWAALPALPRPETPRTLAALAGGFGEFLRRGEVWGLLALRFLPTVYWGCVTLLMPLLLFRLTGSEKPAGYYSGVSLVLSAACQLAAGRLVDRIGVGRPALAAVSLVTVAALGQGIFAHGPWLLMGFGLLGAGAAWTLSITMTTFVQVLSTEETKAKLLGLTHLAWSGGFLAGTLLSGYLGRDAAQARVALLLCGAGCALAAALTLPLVRALPHKG
jgi:MFS family permease